MQASGSAFVSLCCEYCRNEQERNLSTHIRQILEKYGKKTSSGSIFRGLSIRMGRWEFENGLSRRIVPDKSLPLTNITAGSSTIRCPDCPTPQTKKA